MTCSPIAATREEWERASRDGGADAGGQGQNRVLVAGAIWRRASCPAWRDGAYPRLLAQGARAHFFVTPSRDAVVYTTDADAAPGLYVRRVAQ